MLTLTSRRILRVERDAGGDFSVPPATMSSVLRLPPTELRNRLKRGDVRSRVEVGQGEHLGTFRLTLRCRGRLWTATVSADGTVIDEVFSFDRAVAVGLFVAFGAMMKDNMTDAEWVVSPKQISQAKAEGKMGYESSPGTLTVLPIRSENAEAPP